jgi:PilZ domain
MPTVTNALTSILGFTLDNARAVTRRFCPMRPPAKVAVRPHFGSFPATVGDISENGVGLLCQNPIEPGTQVLFLIRPGGRCIRGKVIHATPVRDGWHVGCAFSQNLTSEEVSAYVAPNSVLDDCDCF